MKRIYKRNIAFAIIIGIILILLMVTYRPFTKSYVLVVNLHNSEDSIGTYDNIPIKKVIENNIYYVILKGKYGKYKPSDPPTQVKISLAKDDYDKLSKLDGIYYLEFESSIFSLNKGKFIHLYYDNPYLHP